MHVQIIDGQWAKNWHSQGHFWMVKALTMVVGLDTVPIGVTAPCGNFKLSGSILPLSNMNTTCRIVLMLLFGHAIHVYLNAY